MKSKMKCSKAVVKLFCNLSDELAFDIRQGKCSASSLVQLYKLMIKLELGVVNGWGEGLPKNLKLARHWFDRCVACDPEYLPEVKEEMKKLGL